MAHCTAEQTAVSLAQIDETTAQDSLEVAEAVTDLAIEDFEECEAEH